MKEVLKFIVTFVIIFAFVLYGAFSWGYVTTIVADWYIYPTFPDFPKLNWKEYAGISFFIHCFVHSYISDVKKEYRDTYEKFLALLLAPWILLLAAWMFLVIYK
jgi:amino acid permease